MPQVSVIMPVFNGEKYLAEAIDSILEQTFTDFELLIVDDASQDRSAEIAQCYAQRDERVLLFQLDRNAGAGEARNRGIFAARGEYIAIMDCDDVSLPHRLERQARFLSANPEIGVVGVCGQAVTEDLTTVLFELKVPEAHCLIVFDMFAGIGTIYQAIMARADLLRAVGAYQAGRRHGEDRDLLWRLVKESGAKLANLPYRLLLYRRHSRSLSLSRDANQRDEASEVYSTMLMQLWGAAPSRALHLFFLMRLRKKLGFAQRRAVKKDLLRLIESLIAHKLVDAADRPLLLAETNRRLEGTTPRHWQQFLHWRRHHFGR